MISRRQMLIGSGALLLLGTRAAWAEDTTILSGKAFGTSWQVRLPGRADTGVLAPALQTILKRIDAAMSPFRPDSELSRFNAVAHTSSIRIGPDLAAVAAEALAIAALSEGRFDPSVGPDVGRFGFGPITGTRQGNYAHLSAGTDSLRKAKPRLTIDLCGIAKGYAVDCLLELLATAGHGDALVEIGGEIRTMGHAAGGKPWVIGIENALSQGIARAIAGTSLALATSGDAVHAYELGGRRYSHTIDPATDEPIVNGVASVSVLASSAMRADGLATALMVLGPERGLALADALDVSALFQLRTETGPVLRTNAGFARLIVA